MELKEKKYFEKVSVTDELPIDNDWKFVIDNGGYKDSSFYTSKGWSGNYKIAAWLKEIPAEGILLSKEELIELSKEVYNLGHLFNSTQRLNKYLISKGLAPNTNES